MMTEIRYLLQDATTGKYINRTGRRYGMTEDPFKAVHFETEAGAEARLPVVTIRCTDLSLRVQPLTFDVYGSNPLVLRLPADEIKALKSVLMGLRQFHLNGPDSIQDGNGLPTELRQVVRAVRDYAEALRMKETPTTPVFRIHYKGYHLEGVEIAGNGSSGVQIRDYSLATEDKPYRVLQTFLYLRGDFTRRSTALAKAKAEVDLLDEDYKNRNNLL